MQTPDPTNLGGSDPPGRPVGQPAGWTAEDLERLGRIDPEDEAEARDLWREYAGDGVKSLLDARRSDGVDG